MRFIWQTFRTSDSAFFYVGRQDIAGMALYFDANDVGLVTFSTTTTQQIMTAALSMPQCVKKVLDK